MIFSEVYCEKPCARKTHARIRESCREQSLLLLDRGTKGNVGRGGCVPPLN